MFRFAARACGVRKMSLNSGPGEAVTTYVCSSFFFANAGFGLLHLLLNFFPFLESLLRLFAKMGRHRSLAFRLLPLFHFLPLPLDFLTLYFRF